MSNIIRYCITKEEHEGPNSFRVHRGYILGNPYTHIKDRKTKGQVIVKTREEAISRYERYFEESIKSRPEFRAEFERIVDACMEYDTVYIGCYCEMTESCHGDFIIKKLRQECVKRMVKNAIKTKKSEECV